MSDPVQVAGAAPCVRYPYEGPCKFEDGGRVHPECAVAALEAEGMVGVYSHDAWIARDHELQAAYALLQEARDVLGPLHRPINGNNSTFCELGDHSFDRCPEAAFLSKLDSTLASSTPVPVPPAGIGVENGAVGSTVAVDPAFDGNARAGHTSDPAPTAHIERST